MPSDRFYNDATTSDSLLRKMVLRRRRVTEHVVQIILGVIASVKYDLDPVEPTKLIGHDSLNGISGSSRGGISKSKQRLPVDERSALEFGFDRVPSMPPAKLGLAILLPQQGFIGHIHEATACLLQ